MSARVKGFTNQKSNKKRKKITKQEKNSRNKNNQYVNQWINSRAWTSSLITKFS